MPPGSPKTCRARTDKLHVSYMCMCTLSREQRVEWVRIPPVAAHFSLEKNISSCVVDSPPYVCMCTLPREQRVEWV